MESPGSPPHASAAANAARPARNRVFLSYAHADIEWLNRLTQALAPDIRNGRVDAWDDRAIEMGEEWRQRIFAAIDAARVAVLLVSPTFLQRPFILEEEIPRILAAVPDGLTILWIPLEGTFYGPGAPAALEPIARYQAVCSASRPLAAQEEASQQSTLLDLCRRINRLLGITRVPRNLPFTSIGSLFKGREQALSDLESHLARHGAAAITHAQAITGMGGIGKTRLALEYAWRHESDFSALLFVSANTPQDLDANLARLCARDALDLPEQASPSQPEQLAAVIEWFQKNQGWLLILDNVDTVPAVAAVQALVPKLGGGQVLITSRISRHGSIPTFGLELLEEKDAVAYLLEKTQGRRQPQPDDEAQALRVAQALDRLALALEWAAAYINARHSSFAAYLERWNVLRGPLIDHHDALESPYPASVARTWLASFDQLTANGRRLLRILAWMASEPIPRALLDARAGPFAAEGESGAPKEQQQALVFEAEDALLDLETYSLVSWNGEKTAFEVHGLVQEVTRRSLTEVEQKGPVGAALRWVNNGFVGDPADVRSWPVLEPLVPHARAVAQEADRLSIPEPTARLMNQLGLFLKVKAQWPEAEPLYRRALAIWEKSLGPDHPNVARALNNLAGLLQATNRLAEAEPMYRRALGIDEKSYGPDHPEVARALNNLALLLQATNRLAEAEPMDRRALAIDEKSYGPDHPNVAIRLNNLAGLLRATNRLAEAEPLYRRALGIDEQSYGQDHPNVARDLNNLAGLLRATNRLAEAEPLYRRALAIWEKSYGPDHPNVASTLNNLAELLRATNRLAEAEPLYRRALAIDEKSYGPDHPEVATDLNNLAGLLRATNRLAEAEPLMRRALAIGEKTLGPDHPKVAIRLNNLASLLQATNRLAEAEPLYRRALAIDEKSYGPDHPEVATDLNNLALLLQATNRLAEAEPLMRRAVEIRLKALVPGHPHTRGSLEWLARILAAQGKHEEAAELRRRHDLQ